MAPSFRTKKNQNNVLALNPLRSQPRTAELVQKCIASIGWQAATTVAGRLGRDCGAVTRCAADVWPEREGGRVLVLS